MSLPADDCIAVVIPVRDEARTVAEALESLLAQTVGPQALELLIYDGQSSDATRRIAESFRQRAPWRRFEVMTNALETVPHALNAALAATEAGWFTRVDGRVRLSDNYLGRCVAEARRLGPGTAVGGRFVAQADGPVQSAIAAAVTHPVGVGRGFRTVSGDLVRVGHHPFAVWRTSEVRALGGFDSRLARNQDDEFSMRATARGAHIYLTGSATAVYRPRERLRGLASQYLQYGLWKSAVARRHGLFPLRSLAPSVALVAVVASLAGAISGRARSPLAAVGGSYLLLGWVAGRHQSDATPARTAAALAVVHLAYGAGVIAGAIEPRLTETHLGTGRTT